MAFNGSGTFVRLYSWVNDAAANIKIRADRMDNETNGIAVGLSTCITKDGQTTITANLPMAGYRHTGVGDATDRGHYAKFSQVQDGTPNWADGGGTADAITAAYSVPLTALVDGQLCYVRATAANATTTPTFSPNSLTARTIFKNGGDALEPGDIAGDGHQLILRYDLANTRWELMNPAVVTTSIPYTAASASGPAALEFAEDTDNGTNKVTLKAPASIASDGDITLPAIAGTLATLAGPESLTNKALVDSSTTIVDESDATKKLAFQCSGISTGTTRTLTVPDASGIIALTSGLQFTSAYTSTDQTIITSGGLTLAHGLPSAPKFTAYELVCQSNDNGYTAGQILDAVLCANNQAERGFTAVLDATNIIIRFAAATNVFQAVPAGGGSQVSLPNANWKLRVKAWA